MSETEVHALGAPFAERWLEPRATVSEEQWLAWVEAAAPEIDEDREELVAAAPRSGSGRATAGKGDDLPERVLLRAMIEECGRARWDGPGGRMFRDLAEAVAAPDEHSQVWSQLLSIVDPGGERPASPRPEWLERAYDGVLWKGLLAPASVAALVARLEAPGVVDALAAACADAGQETEGEALRTLVAFLRRAGREGHWVLGLEWST